MSSFRENISREAEAEVRRIVKEHDSLIVEARDLISVFNSLKLDIPKELRNLSPIEEVPKVNLLPLKEVPKQSKGGQAGAQVNKAKAEKRYKRTASLISEELAKGPRLKMDVVKAIGLGLHHTEKTFLRMKKSGEADSRTKGWQGPSEWFLTSRPVTLEQVRDASLKVRQVNNYNIVDPILVAAELDLDQTYTDAYMDQLVAQGILIKQGGTYAYQKPSGPPVNRTKIKEPLPKIDLITPNGRGRAVKGTGRAAKLSSSKEVQQILAIAEAQGAQTKKQGNDKICVSYMGMTRILSKTPGDGNRSNREKLKDLGINV